MEYYRPIPGKITVVQTMPKRYMRAIFKKLLVKEIYESDFQKIAS